MKKNLISATLFFLLCGSCLTIKKTDNAIDRQIPCVFSLDLTKHVIMRFLVKDEIISSYGYRYKDRSNGFCFQFGELCAFLNFEQGYHPANYRYYSYVHEKDTMNIEIGLLRKIDHFIDSVPFIKGNYTILLNKKELYQDTLHANFMKALYAVATDYSTPYLKYVNRKGISFSDYYQQIKSKEHPLNPFKNYVYCQEKGNTYESKSAENYVQEVLGKKYIKVRIQSITIRE